MMKANRDHLRNTLKRFPRLGIARLSTPLEPMKRLSEHLNGPRIWVKRDDCTGLGLGGNKLRKLDVVLRHALDQGVDTLVSGGVVQSNSQRLVAAAAAKLGLGCHLAVYHGRLAPPTKEYAHSGNALLNKLFGATLHDVSWTGDRNAAIETLADELRVQGLHPFVVPYGVSNDLGAVGYASAMLEIADQAETQDFTPAAVVHCSGSAGTQAGLVVAASLCAPETKVVGIDIDAEPERVHADVVSIGKAAARLLGVPFESERVEVIAGHAGPAYGLAHKATWDAIALAGRLEALILDPVYTGKALAGMIALMEKGRWTRQDNLVFLHTGGIPGLFAYTSQFTT